MGWTFKRVRAGILGKSSLNGGGSRFRVQEVRKLEEDRTESYTTEVGMTRRSEQIPWREVAERRRNVGGSVWSLQQKEEGNGRAVFKLLADVKTFEWSYRAGGWPLLHTKAKDWERIKRK